MAFCTSSNPQALRHFRTLLPGGFLMNRLSSESSHSPFAVSPHANAADLAVHVVQARHDVGQVEAQLLLRGVLEEAHRDAAHDRVAILREVHLKKHGELKFRNTLEDVVTTNSA